MNIMRTTSSLPEQMSRQESADSVAAEVEKLLGRLADGLLLQDRQEAVVLLCELLQNNEQAKKVVGMTGLPVLCTILKEDQGDKHMLRGALECLNIAIAPSPGGFNRQSPSAMNAEMFARGPENVPLLLGILQQQSDFYVRYHTVQLLTGLAASGTPRLAQAILDTPQGVVRLTELLVDSHEVLKNEALLLLVTLAHASPDFRQAAASKGVFEQLITIIRKEGGTDGGIVVQDCFELLNTLLRRNPQNQLMFREGGQLGAVLDMLKLPESLFSRGLPRQRAANLLCLLDTLTLNLTQQIDAPGGQAAVSATSQMQAAAEALLAAGLLDKLIMLALKGSDPSAQSVRNQALLCLAHLISQFPRGQEKLVMSGLGWMNGTPALRQVLRICLHTRDAQEHSAARSVIRAFCHGNADGQSMLAATLVPPADQSPGSTTFGGEIVKALNSPEVATAGRAAAVLTCMLDDNLAVKQRLLNIPLELTPPPGQPPSLLLPHCISHLSNALFSPGGEDQQAAALFLRLLVTWLTECESSVTAFMANTANIPFIVDIITARKGGSSVAVTGLAALLLGTCLVSQKEDASTAAVDVITTKVGLAAFFEKLEGLYGDAQFQEAAKGPKAPRAALRTGPASPRNEEGDDNAPRPGTITENPFDHPFTAWAQAFKQRIREHLMGTSRPEAPPQETSAARMQSLQGRGEGEQLREAASIIQRLEREVESLRSRNRALTEQAIDSQRPPSHPPAPPLPVSFPSSSDAAASQESIAALRDAERRATNAEARVASRDAENERLRSEVMEIQGKLSAAESRQQQTEQRLRDSQRECQEAQRDCQEAQAASSRLEAELEALSSAYTSIEAHAHALEEQLAGRPEDANGLKKADTGAADEEEDGDDDQLGDLLACLGEEEQKVQILQSKLVELGIDPAPLLIDLGIPQSDDEDLT